MGSVSVSSWLQTIQPTSGGAVTDCVKPCRPQFWGSGLAFFVQAGHADPLDGWRCSSQNQVISRLIQADNIKQTSLSL